mgnify:CR=1 FL=1
MNTINQKHQLLKIRLETTMNLIPSIGSRIEGKKLLYKELYKRARNLIKELGIIETEIKLMKDINNEIKLMNYHKSVRNLGPRNRLMKDINRINELIKINLDDNRELIAHLFINKQNKLIKKFILYSNIYKKTTNFDYYNYSLTPFSYWVNENNNSCKKYLAIDKLINKRLDNIFFIGKSIKDRKLNSKIHNKELVYNLELNNIFFCKSLSRKKLMGIIMKM